MIYSNAHYRNGGYDTAPKKKIIRRAVGELCGLYLY